MPPKDLSDKERAFLAAAQREAAAKASAATHSSPGQEAPGPTAVARAARNESEPSVSTTGGVPLDQATVAGWDHPVARASAEAAGKAAERERWAIVGELLRAERMAATARRERLRRNGLGVLAALLLLVLVAALTTLLPGLTH